MTRTEKKCIDSRDSMLEVVVENYLVDRIEALGYLCEKHVSPGRRGPPDRLVTWPCGLDLVETKAPGKKPRIDQQRDHKRRAKIGGANTRVYLIDTKKKVDQYIEWRRDGLIPYDLLSPYV